MYVQVNNRPMGHTAHMSNKKPLKISFVKSYTKYLYNVKLDPVLKKKPPDFLLLNIETLLKLDDFIVICHIEHCSSPEDLKQLFI